MRFCKENHAVGQGEGIGIIIGIEPDNKIKYQEEKDNAYKALMEWKRNFFDLAKGTPGKAFINELTKLINQWSSKSVIPSLILQRSSRNPM